MDWFFFKMFYLSMSVAFTIQTPIENGRCIKWSPQNELEKIDKGKKKNNTFVPYEKRERVEWELDMRNQMEWDKNWEFPILPKNRGNIYSVNEFYRLHLLSIVYQTLFGQFTSFHFSTIFTFVLCVEIQCHVPPWQLVFTLSLCLLCVYMYCIYVFV